MKKHLNLVTLIFVVVALASLFAAWKGFPLVGGKTGFSSGG
jgi:hypothetical protein